jgi:hypothetical protein
MDSPDIEFCENTLLTIIGSSGRNEPINLELFEAAKLKCIEWVKNLPFDIEDIILQSGGSSGIDHLAIILFLEGIDGKKFSGLNLFLPCHFDFINRKFISQSKYTESSSKTLNEIHSRFSFNIQRNTFEDFISIKDEKNVSIQYGMGFYDRNRMLAKQSNITLAMTFGKDKPTDGGTLFTWNLIPGKNKTHISLKV